MTIFDLVKATEITAYWEEKVQDMPPYLGEELWDTDKKLGLNLEWIKGASGLPVVLKPSAFDVGAVPRPRIGFEELKTKMPFFKESTYIDEELRQELNMVMETGNQAYIDTVMRRVFNDQTQLLSGARVRREEMRMMALTTGAIAISANGQDYDYDYGVPNDHKITISEAAKKWSATTATPIDDMRGWMDTVEDDTGIRPTRGVCTRKTWAMIRSNPSVVKGVTQQGEGSVAITDSQLTTYIQDQLGLELIIYGKRYKDDTGTATQFVPDNTVVLFPEGKLGTTWFGTTPEESDLLNSNVANVSITDTGVAVTTIQKTDPVNVETKVTMVCLPSFEAADSIIIADVA